MPDAERIRQRYQGIVKGPGTTISDSIPAQLSRDESVINARSTQKHYDLLSAINEDGGGVPFPDAQAIDLLSGVRSSMANLRAQSQARALASPGPVYVTSAMLGQSAGAHASGTGGIDPVLLAGLVKQGVAEALQEMPAPRIVVSDYERKAGQVKTIQHTADI